jgi:hypothetical protein
MTLRVAGSGFYAMFGRGGWFGWGVWGSGGLELGGWGWGSGLVSVGRRFSLGFWVDGLDMGL